MDRLMRIAARFAPTLDQVWIMGVRLSVAAGAFVGAKLLQQDWMLLISKLFAMMSIWMLMGLWEKQVVDHARQAVLRLSRRWRQPSLPPLQSWPPA